MPKPPARDVTALLESWRGGDDDALAALMPKIQDELHRLARGYLSRERQDHTLQATALVNEAYLRMVDQRRVHWRGKLHFVALSAQMMRRILVDHARGKHMAKRGGGVAPVRVEDMDRFVAEAPERITEVDDALRDLAVHDAELARLVELRFFGGMSGEEIAEYLQVSVPTVTRRWRLARAWLHRRLSQEGADGE